jgi:nitrogen fixation protein NifU and related proteins
VWCKTCGIFSPSIEVSSPAFDQGGVIPTKHTGEGQDVSSLLIGPACPKEREVEAEIETFKDQMVGKKEFTELDDLAAFKGVVKYPSRIKCAVLAWSAFHEGLTKGGRGSEEPVTLER